MNWLISSAIVYACSLNYGVVAKEGNFHQDKTMVSSDSECFYSSEISEGIPR
jgi:hypothetical protein